MLLIALLIIIAVLLVALLYAVDRNGRETRELIGAFALRVSNAIERSEDRRG